MAAYNNSSPASSRTRRFEVEEEEEEIERALRAIEGLPAPD